MCGIASIFSYSAKAPAVNREELRMIRDSMIARGPDASGEWFSEDGRVGMGHRRLSIIDLSEMGNQPMTLKDNSATIVFNGEIYNYRELKAMLIEEGCQFSSNSDTEVILQLYKLKGIKAVKDLRGMFAFSLWDHEKRSMFVARDPYGIKPLYYSDYDNTFRTASQVKAILSGGVVPKTQSPAGLVGFYLFGSVPEPYCIYESIKPLPSGHYMTIDEHGMHEPVCFDSISGIWNQESDLPIVDLEEKVHEALLDSVRAHFVSDVPVGIFLSSGIDSTAITGLARDCGIRDIQTITMTYEEYKGHEEDEAPLAQHVAEHYQTSHHTYYLNKDEFKKGLPHIFQNMDQPSIDGVNTYFVSKFAHERGLKVVLSGVGGDELFGGYPSFQSVPKIYRSMKLISSIPGLGGMFRSISMPLTRCLSMNPKLSGLVTYGGSLSGAYFLQRGLFMPWELGKVLGEEIIQQGLSEMLPEEVVASRIHGRVICDYSAVASFEAMQYMQNQLLRDSDWASMAHSLELRTPLVDIDLLKKVAALIRKNILSPEKSMLASGPSSQLPESVLNRPKTGFTVPIGKWLKESASWQGQDENNTREPWARTWSRHVLQEYSKQ